MSDKDNGHALLLRAFHSNVIIIVNLGHLVTFVTICDHDVRVKFNALRNDNKVSHRGQPDFRSRISCALSHIISDDHNKLVGVQVIRRPPPIWNRQ